jgi:hypothetical protein
MATSYTVTYREVIAIRSFLGYLHTNYSKQIGTSDTYVIAAVAAWFYASTGGGKNYQYNNPFGLRAQGALHRTATGYAYTVGPLLRFKTLAEGFVAAAKALMKGVGNKASGYLLVLNALKHGGNQAAVDFLAALAMSQWDSMGYGAMNWQEAYSQDRNKLLAFYTHVKGVQLTSPTRPRPAKPPHRLPRDYYYTPIARTYLNPWAAGNLYRSRHGHSAQSTTGRNRP